MTEQSIEQTSENHARLSRRQFLKMLGLLAAGSALAACSEAQQASEFGRERYTTVTPASLLESPQAPTPQATANPNLASFMALSAALTGFENLDPQLGQVYLASLENNPEMAPLSEIYTLAGISGSEDTISLETLASTQVFEQEATRSLANEILNMWYTGVYTQDGEPKVATFVDSLAWKSLRYTKPATTCGSFGFWATRPEADVSRH